MWTWCGIITEGGRGIMIAIHWTAASQRDKTITAPFHLMDIAPEFSLDRAISNVSFWEMCQTCKEIVKTW